jgi:serine/threonine protein kinase
MRTLTFQRIIGVGAMGTVYLAELRDDGGQPQVCAVKVMNRSAPDLEQFRARMRDEARLLSMLQDEQILGVRELVSVGGHDCLVMEYVEGVDLSELIREPDPREAAKAGKGDAEGPKRVRVPPKALAELGAELAGTLHRAHSATHPTTGEPLRVIHRDVKPANIMVTTRGGVRLLDFGVARAAFESRESNTQGLVLGTLNYFPPEVMAGAEPTPAVDLYGLGLSLWECASGTDWGSPQVHRHRFERRVEQRLSELAPEYASLLSTLRRLLAWRPNDRPTGAQAEKLLLSAAELCSGAGLRSWARMVVPPMLEKRQPPQVEGALVGQGLTLEAEPAAAPPSPRPTASPRRAPKPPPPGIEAIDPALIESATERIHASQTFNDLAPPAAVTRSTERTPPLDTGAIPELPLDPPTDEAKPSELPTTRLALPPEARRKRAERRIQIGPTVLWLSFSAIMGIAVGSGVLLAIVLVTWLTLG